MRAMNDEAAPNPATASKSARKRAATSLQDLGVRLAELESTVLDELELPENLRGAITQLQRLTSRAAQVRQRQYVGKLMRHLDSEPILAKLEERKRRHDLDVRRFQRMERWRDRLIEEGAAMIDEFMAEHPNAERAALARLISQARHQRDHEFAPSGARALFVYIRSLS
jgi:ribosome-associated protein